ncbi:MAG: peptide-methionine (S)-S-oxide reductase MsrA [bacterium]|nr:peptide-methionine (S)-S-oxide reductase MsrA [bacterium]
MNEIAVFGGGCFWCTEAVFKMLRGVSSVLPGYAGGTTKNPTYEQVSSGRTGHAESVQITYNPQLITYKDLLTVFFGSHDPTMVNRQGDDVGTQYRSVIFYTTPDQKKVAEELIKEINSPSQVLSDKIWEGKPVLTELVPLDVFYEAENYHRDYFATHPGNPYCEVVINPKLEKVQKMFADLLKSSEDTN